jgi:hypothetical protein
MIYLLKGNNMSNIQSENFKWPTNAFTAGVEAFDSGALNPYPFGPEHARFEAGKLSAWSDCMDADDFE